MALCEFINLTGKQGSKTCVFHQIKMILDFLIMIKTKNIPSHIGLIVIYNTGQKAYSLYIIWIINKYHISDETREFIGAIFNNVCICNNI